MLIPFLWFCCSPQKIWCYSDVKWPIPVDCWFQNVKVYIVDISALTTSNLPWFMVLTSHIAMVYISLQHQTFFLPPVILFFLFVFLIEIPLLALSSLTLKVCIRLSFCTSFLLHRAFISCLPLAIMIACSESYLDHSSLNRWFFFLLQFSQCFLSLTVVSQVLFQITRY